MGLPFPVVLGPIKVNQIQTAGMVNISPFNRPVTTKSSNKTNRVSDNYGDLSVVPTIASFMVDNDVLDYIFKECDLNI